MRSKSHNNQVSGGALTRPLRLAYFVSHPIQYQAPLLRRIAAEPDIDLTVFFFSDVSVRAYVDPGFGVNVKWDVPLLSGYKYEFLPSVRDTGRLSVTRPLNWGFTRRLRKGKFDAVWVHGYAALNALQAILAARFLRIPVLLRAESTLFDRPRSGLLRAMKQMFFKALESCVDGILSIGAANSAYWHAYFAERVRIFEFPYTVDNQFFQSQCRSAHEKREAFRHQLGLQKGRPIILFASKLQERKRCGDLLEAFLRLRSTQTNGPCPYLLIVGDGEKRAELERRAASAVPGDVRFLGFQNQTALPSFYDLCDVFVLASVDEPWGLVINEVMNAAKPLIVSTEVGCQQDLVEDGVNGYVIQPGDINGLAGALIRVLANPALAGEMGLRSREKIEAYSFEQNVMGLRDALQALVPGFWAQSQSHATASSETRPSPSQIA